MGQNQGHQLLLPHLSQFQDGTGIRAAPRPFIQVLFNSLRLPFDFGLGHSKSDHIAVSTAKPSKTQKKLS